VPAIQPPPTASDHAATWRFDYPIYHVETRPQWRSWLKHNHTSTRGVWLCSWRTSTGRPRGPYPDVVEEAICFGWIDSTSTFLDDDRGLQLITPRRAKSSWSRLSRRRAADMEGRGLMTHAGRAAIDAAKANGWWTISDQVEDLEELSDLAAAWTNNFKHEPTGTASRRVPASRCSGGSAARPGRQRGPVELRPSLPKQRTGAQPGADLVREDSEPYDCRCPIIDGPCDHPERRQRVPGPALNSAPRSVQT
jgi:uncharacterized protein YdeI (YjbR/CyaY-like superfamily)